MYGIAPDFHALREVLRLESWPGKKLETVEDKITFIYWQKLRDMMHVGHWIFLNISFLDIFPDDSEHLIIKLLFV